MEKQHPVFGASDEVSPIVLGIAPLEANPGGCVRESMWRRDNGVGRTRASPWVLR